MSMLGYISNPFLAFVTGISVMYGLLICTDVILRRTKRKHHDDYTLRMKDLYEQVNDLETVSPDHFRTADSLEQDPGELLRKLEETTHLYEGLLNTQYNEKAELQKKLETLTGKLDGLNQAISHIREEKTETDRKFVKISNELDQVREDHRSELEHEKKSLSEQRDKEQKEHEQASALLRDEIAEIISEKEVLASQLKELQSVKSDLSAELRKAREEHESAVAVSEKQDKDFKEKTAALESRVAELEQVNSELSAELETARTDYSSEQKAAEKKLSGLEKEKAELEERVNNLEQEKNGLAAELDNKSEEILETESGMKQELEAVLKERDSIKSELEELTKDLSEDAQALEKTVAEKMSLEKQNSELRAELQELKAAAAEHKKNMGETGRELENLKAETEIREKKLTIQIQELEKTVESLKSEAARPKADPEQIQNLTAEVEKYKGMCDDLQKKVQKYRKTETVEDPVLAMKQNPVAKTLYEENRNMAAKLEDYLAQIREMQGDLEEMELLYVENMALQERVQELEAHGAGSVSDRKSVKKKSKKKSGGGKKNKEDEIIPQARSHSEDSVVLSTEDLLAEIEDINIPGAEALLKPPKPAPEPMKKNLNVFLPRLNTKERRAKAVPLIMQVTGMSEEEAEKLAKKAVIPLAKGVDQIQADDIKALFKPIGVIPRIKKHL